MNIQHEDLRPTKPLENSLLVIAALIANALLVYQLSGWVNGLNPTFVHPNYIQHSPFPFFFLLVAVHPLIWFTFTVIIFIRICQNYEVQLNPGPVSF